MALEIQNTWMTLVTRDFYPTVSRIMELIDCAVFSATGIQGSNDDWDSFVIACTENNNLTTVERFVRKPGNELDVFLTCIRKYVEALPQSESTQIVASEIDKTHFGIQSQSSDPNSFRLKWDAEHFLQCRLCHFSYVDEDTDGFWYMHCDNKTHFCDDVDSYLEFKGSIPFPNVG